jgi:two-component system cell cycle response regulator DivK
VTYRILVVEDNAMNRELLCDWLDAEGYEVQCATTLQEARHVCESGAPHAVLLDVQLGTEDGLQLARWLRERNSARHIPIIAVTALAMLADQQRILESGCDACVPKPVDFSRLREQLRLWLAAAANVDTLGWGTES